MNTEIIKAQDSKEFLLSPLGQEIKSFELAQRQAMMYASSSIVPQQYKGDANLGNCIIAIDMAKRLGANPLMVMQNLYIVHGNPAWSSKFLIATINQSGRFAPLRYEFKGDEGTLQRACRCLSYESSDKEHKEPLYGDWVSLSMAKAEGWSTKPGSKWTTMPEQMLRYRAASFWQRVYAPEISMGILTRDEVEDTYVDYEEIPSTTPQPQHNTTTPPPSVVSFATAEVAEESQEQPQEPTQEQSQEQPQESAQESTPQPAPQSLDDLFL